MPEEFKLRWPVERHVVNQYFGEHPEWYAPFGLPGHEGLDLFAPTNADIFAAADGRVSMAKHPSDHPYGLQVRIKHTVGNKVYETVYAHLAATLVNEGDNVKAGQRIGKADNTGNSFGSHLHLTLKLEGAQTPGYPKGIIDPWPFLRDTDPAGGAGAGAAPPPAGQPQPPQGVTAKPGDLVVYPTDLLSLRAAASANAERLEVLNESEALVVLEDVQTARQKIGQPNVWLQVTRLNGQKGFVAAQYVRATGQAAPATTLIVFPNDLLSVRARPAAESNRLTVAETTTALTVLGDAAAAQAKIGVQGEWLNVKTPDGYVGYVAAWFVRAGAAAPAAPPPAAAGELMLASTADINLRAQPTLNAPRTGGAFTGKPLKVLDEPAAARAKLGKQNEWIFVQNDAGEKGWAAAWFLAVKNP